MNNCAPNKIGVIICHIEATKPKLKLAQRRLFEVNPNKEIFASAWFKIPPYVKRTPLGKLEAPDGKIQYAKSFGCKRLI